MQWTKNLKGKFPNTTLNLLFQQVGRLNDCEVVVHISYEAQKAPLSEILHCLENNGLYLLNGSSSETFGGRAFHNLHFQVCLIISLIGKIYFNFLKIKDKKHQINLLEVKFAKN